MKAELMISTIIGDGKMPIPDVAICEATAQKIELRERMMRAIGISENEATAIINMIAAEDPSGEVIGALLGNQSVLNSVLKTLSGPIKATEFLSRKVRR